MSAGFDITNFKMVSNASSTTTSTLASCTVASGDNMLVVFLEAYTASGSTTVSTTTWNGASMTFYGRVILSTAGVDLEMWYLASPTPGTGTVTATYSAALNGFNYISFIPMTGVNVSSVPTSSFGTYASGGNDAPGPGLPLTVTATGAGVNDVYVGCVQSNVTAITNTGSMVNLGTSATVIGSTDYILGINTGVFTWNSTGGTNNNANGQAVAVFGSGGTAPFTPFTQTQFFVTETIIQS